MDGSGPRHGLRADAGQAATPAPPTEPAPATDATRRNFVKETLFYVPILARRYLNRGLTFDELIAAGNLGLVEAALRFDPRRNVQFTTYANWWIRKSMIEAMGHQSGPMRLPRYQHDKLRLLRETRRRWVTRVGRQPDSAELADAAGMPREEVERLQTMGFGSVSLEQPLTPQDERPLKETLEDQDIESPHIALVRRDLSERLHRQLAGLDIRDRQVLSLRFGLSEGLPLTLRETGIKLGISRERVRQVELRALGRLKELI